MTIIEAVQAALVDPSIAILPAVKPNADHYHSLYYKALRCERGIWYDFCNGYWDVEELQGIHPDFVPVDWRTIPVAELQEFGFNWDA